MQEEYKQPALEQISPSAPLSKCTLLHDLEHVHLTDGPLQNTEPVVKQSSIVAKPDRLLQAPRAVGRQLSRGVSQICQHQSFKRLKSDVMCLHIVDGVLTHQVQRRVSFYIVSEAMAGRWICFICLCYPSAPLLWCRVCQVCKVGKLAGGAAAADDDKYVTLKKAAAIQDRYLQMCRTCVKVLHPAYNAIAAGSASS
jgi:hypothetical protein